MGLARPGCARGYAGVLGCAPAEVALTGSTTDGVNTVIGGLDLRAGDEILTTDEEHPGLLAPLGRARRRHGVSVRVVPFAEIAGEVIRPTRLVACSHVSWVSGQVVECAALAATGVPVLLDAAQGIGAVPVDVHALGCDYYAGSGQKWLCGPEGSGCLFVRPSGSTSCSCPWPGYRLGGRRRSDALEFEPAEGTARLDHGFPVGMRSAWALASLEVFAAAGWEWVHARAAALAAWLAGRAGRARARGAAARALDAGVVEGGEPTRRPRWSGWPARASSCGASRPAGSSVRRSARGPPRRSSSGWSDAG